MKWLDDDGLYREILPAARSAIEWMLSFGDIDDDGYIEYSSKSTGGINKKGWSDSRSAITHPDGTRASHPIALAETQGYLFRALSEMAELLERKGENELAHGLIDRASKLKQNFNRDYWLEEQRYFAQALDSNKNAVANITSSIGHCLFCGIIDEDKSRYVATRLSSPEMASGWGIRTMSNRSPIYNPMSYRNGSVWPNENSIIVAGMKRYGYNWEVEEITSQLFDSSAFFAYHRLPELFGGFSRDREAYSIPAEYPASCSPHASAAGSVFLLFQSLLGLQVDAAAKRIYLSPRLPSWLQHATITNLSIGHKTVNLHFDRRALDEETRFEISDNEAGVEVVIPPR
jgi:glycogen debranching enzyme